MALEPWIITTTYPDGRTEEIADGEAQLIAEEAAKAEREAAKASALAKLQALGLTEQEAQIIAGL